MAWEPKTLSDKIVYAKGWNDAVRAAAKIADNPCFIEAQDSNWDNGVNFAKRVIANAIRKLDRSMQAC